MQNSHMSVLSGIKAVSCQASKQGRPCRQLTWLLCSMRPKPANMLQRSYMPPSSLHRGQHQAIQNTCCTALSISVPNHIKKARLTSPQDSGTSMTSVLKKLRQRANLPALQLLHQTGLAHPCAMHRSSYKHSLLSAPCRKADGSSSGRAWPSIAMRFVHWRMLQTPIKQQARQVGDWTAYLALPRQG
jgi:hypothetical protein